MSDFETIIYEKINGKAYVTLNRPDAMNVYNIQMRNDLYEILSAIKDDVDVRVVIFKSACERAFCAGADLSEFLSAPPPVAAREVRFERDIWNLFNQASPGLCHHNDLFTRVHSVIGPAGTDEIYVLGNFCGICVSVFIDLACSENADALIIFATDQNTV